MSSDSSEQMQHLAAEMLALEPGVIIAQKYRLERLLKHGGMGAVWIATHLGLETTVAIKFMSGRMLDFPTHVEDDEGARSNPRTLTRVRFEREAKAAARIRSTNVVQMLDHGIDNGTPYIVMEYLRGEDLEMRLKRVNRMTFTELLPIVNAIGRALVLAHAEELVHRDLKPENIFLAKEGDEEIPKILDFGVAKAKNGPTEQHGPELPPENRHVDGTTIEGTMVGTPHYMSPEQIQVGAQVDHRADLWAFGVLIFRALTGCLPFPSPRLLELAMQICREPIPTATSVAPDLPPTVDLFFEKALSRDPKQRFQSAREMVAAYQELITGQSTAASALSGSTASLATTVVPSDNRVENNRTVMYVLAGAGFVIAVGGGLFAWLAGSSPKQGAETTSAQALVPSAPASSSAAANAVPAPIPEASASASASAPAATSKTPATNPRTTGTGKTKKRNVGY